MQLSRERLLAIAGGAVGWALASATGSQGSRVSAGALNTYVVDSRIAFLARDSSVIGRHHSLLR